MAITNTSFFTAALGKKSPRRKDYRDALIAQLMKNSLGPQKIEHPTQGFAQLANTALVASLMRDSRAEQEERDMKVKGAIAAMLGEAGGRDVAFTGVGPKQLGAGGGPVGSGPLTDVNVHIPGNPYEALLRSGISELTGPAIDAKLAAAQQEKDRSYTEKTAREKRRLDQKQWEERYEKEQAGRLAVVKAKGGLKGGNLTAAQLANNQEIDEARARLQEMERDLPPGVSLSDDIHRRISVTDPTTGRLTPDFNSFLGRTAWQAMQRKVGEDRDQARWSRLLINPPEFSEPAGPKALPPGVSAEQPGILDRIGDYFSGGDDTSAPVSGTPPRRGGPRGRVRGRRGAKAVTSMGLTEIDDLINSRGNTLSPAELRAIQARLAALGM